MSSPSISFSCAYLKQTNFESFAIFERKHFPESFGFISLMHLLESPQRTFGLKRQNLRVKIKGDKVMLHSRFLSSAWRKKAAWAIKAAEMMHGFCC